MCFHPLHLWAEKYYCSIYGGHDLHFLIFKKILKKGEILYLEYLKKRKEKKEDMALGHSEKHAHYIDTNCNNSLVCKSYDG